MFNALTGLNQKTANYPGVTTEIAAGQFTHNNTTFTIADLPGTYSLFPKSLDEEVACKSCVDNFDRDKQYDIIAIVIDACNLKRHLLLATQIIDLKKPCILILNMFDEAQKEKILIDTAELEKQLGIPVFPVNSRNKEGLQKLKDNISKAHISSNIFFSNSNLSRLNPKLSNFCDLIAYQFETTDLKEKEHVHQIEINDSINRFKNINYIFSKCVQQKNQASSSLTKQLDTFFLNKIFGLLFFLFINFILFQLIFYLAEWPTQFIEFLFSKGTSFIAEILPKGEINDLIVNGLLAGISGIVVFVPQIALLFMFIGILEDSGYMSRASYMLDSVMKKIGINGKSIIPIISSVACAVPSIMGTRTISNWKERIITILIIPLVSCSARLPVYTLIISILFNKQSMIGPFNIQGLALMFLYLLGFASAFIAAICLNFFIKSNEKKYFVIELPKYRIPFIKNTITMVITKVKTFLFDAGKIILAISIVLWFLSNHGSSQQFDTTKTQLTQNNTFNKDSLKSKILEESYAGVLGKKIEPIIKPLGFDWKIGIALITSFAAREVFVGTMATIYSCGSGNNKNQTLREQLMSQKDYKTNKPIFTPAVCWSLLIFYAFALQCMSTIAVTYRETKHWKWPAIQLIYISVLAYTASLLVFHFLN